MTTRLRNLAIGAVGAGAVLILVCCANVLSLAFTRGLYRASDLITLNALGATPARLARLLLGEGASVAALAAAAGLAVASAAFIVLRAVAPAGYTSPGMSMFTARTTTVVGLAGVAAFMSWCCGSLSAWRIAGHSGLLRVSHGDGRPMRVMRFCVLATQMAGTCFFLAGAAFLGRSYLNLMAIDSGVDVRAMGLSVSYSSELPAATLADSVDRTLAALRRTPGVTAAGASVGGFIDGRTGFGSVMINGRYSRITLTQVSHGYFDAAGMQLVAGRLLEEAERDAVIVNESFVRRYFAGRIPIGYRLTRGDTVQTIVGVIKDVRSIGLTVAPEPGVFEAVREWNSQVPVTYIVSAPDLSRLAGSDWQRIVHAVEPSAVVLDSTSLQQRLNRSILDRTFAFLILGLFALATVVASATGVASVVAHTAARRTREIAIRLALGAKVSSTLWLVMRQTFIAGLCGAFGGLVAAAWVSKTLSSLLYGVPPGDGVTLFLVALGALTVLVFATLLPARRAGGLSPTVALRLD
jgi:ABC-type antimicrobial peptide transport system permease subunit